MAIERRALNAPASRLQQSRIHPDIALRAVSHRASVWVAARASIWALVTRLPNTSEASSAQTMIDVPLTDARKQLMSSRGSKKQAFISPFLTRA